jgi:hypothetical protein
MTNIPQEKEKIKIKRRKEVLWGRLNMITGSKSR